MGAKVANVTSITDGEYTENAIRKGFTIKERTAITAGGGKSTWLQSSPWPGTIKLCSDDERGGKNS